MKWSAVLFWGVALGANAMGPAQTVYRCGDEYSQAPCPQGTVVDNADSRTPEQRAEAQRLNASEARRGAEMRSERLADQKAQKSLAAASLSPTPAAKPASSAERKLPKRKHASARKPTGTPFTARDPKRPLAPKS